MIAAKYNDLYTNPYSGTNGLADMTCTGVGRNGQGR